MIGFFKDQALTLPVNQGSPMAFLFPLAGSTKYYTLWLGDPFFATLLSDITSGAGTIQLSDTSEFLTAGTATINGNTFTYTGKTQSTLTGCSGITAAYTHGAIVKPSKVYKGISVIGISSSNSSAPDLRIGLSPGVPLTPYSFPGTSAHLYVSQVTTPVAVYVQVAVGAGVEKEYTNWTVYTDTLYVKDSADSSSVGGTTAGLQAIAYGYAFRRQQAPGVFARVLPINRKLASQEPGFIVGEYRWRDRTQINSVALTPPNWNLQPEEIGLESFVPGIGYGTDLELESVDQAGDSLNPRIHSGEYFTGAYRYYLPANKVAYIVPGFTATSFTLPSKPKRQTPIFVGTFQVDSDGYYDRQDIYEYQATLLNPDFSNRTDLPAKYFTLDRHTLSLTINTPITGADLYVGFISGETNDTFFMPKYPLFSVTSVYSIDAIGVKIYSNNYAFDKDSNLLVIRGTTGSSIPGAAKGAAIYVSYIPGLLIQYDLGTDDDTVLEPIELNPAFSGIGTGYLYLEHRKQIPATLTLVADKPEIDIPSTASVTGKIIAYGPVYNRNDYALLTATAYSLVFNETVANAKLRIVVEDGFIGLINYKDPNAQEIDVITGGDGKANFVYTPKSDSGYWIPKTAASGSLAGIATTHITGDTIVLPVGIDISQVRDTITGWYTVLYLVFNNDPIYGSVGADTTNGEVAFTTTGTPGTITFKTNGAREAWAVGENIIQPIEALDSTGTNFNQPGFNGSVVKLVFGSTIPVSSIIANYFVSFLERVTISVQSIDNPDVVSNYVTLQLDIPPIIVENPWLYLQDQIQGILGQYRLGVTPRPTHSV